MTELDFDELDKAVNSLMGGRNAPVKPQPPQPTPSPASTTTPITPPSSPLSPRPAPPAVRRGGRFMDVVPATRKEATSPSVSRQGTTVQPASSPITAAPSSKPAKATSSIAPPTDKNPAPVTQSAATDWPDPLELAGAKNDEETNASALSTPGAPAEVSTPSGEKAETLSQQEPLSSPFLPDAKVEKRPLGVSSSDSTGHELTVEGENTQLPALPKDVEPALPEELHGDVVSIEADNSTTDPSKHATLHQDTEATPEDIPKSRVSEVTITEAPIPSGPVSIPQQYKEESSSGDQKNGAIYDTDSYHQPLSHPVKKKSGWGWVIWILVILLVGAGGGAALYFMGIF